MQTTLWSYIFSISFMKFRPYVRGQNESLQFKQSKANNSSVTKDILTILHVHNHTMVVYTQYTFHEIPSIAY